MDLPTGDSLKKRDSKKQTLVIVGTFALVVLAVLQLRKMNSGNNTTPGTAPSAAFTPYDGTGASAGGTSGVPGGTTPAPGTGTGQTTDATASLLSSFQDTLNGILGGFSQQSQANQAAIDSELNGLSQQQHDLTEAFGTLNTTLSGIASKVTDLPYQVVSPAANPSTGTVPHPVAIPSHETPAKPVPSAGPAKPPATVTPVFTTIRVNAGDSWNTIEKKTGLSADQLRSLNGGHLDALATGNLTVRTK